MFNTLRRICFFLFQLNALDEQAKSTQRWSIDNGENVINSKHKTQRSPHRYTII